MAAAVTAAAQADGGCSSDGGGAAQRWLLRPGGGWGGEGEAARAPISTSCYVRCVRCAAARCEVCLCLCSYMLLL